MQADENKKNKRPSHQIEFVLLGALIFILFFTLMLGGYRHFMLGRVKSSTEFRMATFYLTHSSSIRKAVGFDVERLLLLDVNVREGSEFGVSNLVFTATSQQGHDFEIAVGLVKIQDFWIVIDVLHEKKYITSTYSKIIMFLENIDLGDITAATQIFEDVKNEISEESLVRLLQARLNMASGKAPLAEKDLVGLSEKMRMSRLTPIFEKAQAAFMLGEYEQVIHDLLLLDENYRRDFEGLTSLRHESLFAGLPHNALVSWLDPDTTAVRARKLLSLAYHLTWKFEEGLHWADAAAQLAHRHEFSVLEAESQYIKALNAYALKNNSVAESLFRKIVTNPSHPNLSQKAWSAYFLGEMAAKSGRDEEALSLFESAAHYEPSNAALRKNIIDYLMTRNKPGDLFIALAYSLRGEDIGYEVGSFKSRSTMIREKLGIKEIAGR